MKTIKGFVKKYWVTAVIFIGLACLYYYVADVVKLNPYLFPTTEKDFCSFKLSLPIRLVYCDKTYTVYDFFAFFRCKVIK